MRSTVVFAPVRAFLLDRQRRILLYISRTAGVLVGIVRLAGRRLLAKSSLVLVAGAGLVAAAALTLSIPVYSDATHFRLLRERLNGGQGQPWEAPLPFLLSYDGAGRRKLQWKQIARVDEYLAEQASRDIGLRPISIVRRIHTDSFELYPPLDPQKPATRFFITNASLGMVSDARLVIEVIAGDWPAPAAPEEPLQVLVSLAVVEEFGVQPGDRYFLRRDSGVDLPVLISGVWRPLEAKAPYWDVRASSMLIIPEEAYRERVAPLLEDELRTCAWYLTLDGSKLHASDIPGLAKRIQGTLGRAVTLLPQLKVEISPVSDLEIYQEDAPALTFLLYAFSLPILGLVLVFVGLVASVYIGEKRNEIAVLRSRGGSALQMAGTAAVEGTLLGLLALGLGIPAGGMVAGAIGRARSFLDFSAPPDLRISLTPGMLGFGILTVGLILLVQFILPTLAAARHTIITYRQERARQQESPAWQRYYLDVLLLIPAGYGAMQLSNQAEAAAAGAQAPDPLQNPLLLLVPALGIFALTLIVLRLTPRLMGMLAWALNRTHSVGMLMAARYLSRTPAFFNAPLILLVLTLSLSAFTASLALTLDRHLTRQTYYSTGADLAVLEQGSPAMDADNNVIYTFGPVEEHLSLPGVVRATRVGRYTASVRGASGSAQEGTYYGIDRLSFPEVAFWQPGFANQPLGSLLNSLAETPGGLLVSQKFLQEEGLQIGDSLLLSVASGGESKAVEATIVGTVDLFPTWYPESGPLFVGSLDDLFTFFNRSLPHEAWLSLEDGVNPEDVVYAVRGFSILLDLEADHTRLVRDGLNVLVERWNAASVIISNEQSRPERQGLFGLLSVGFITASLLTVLGFLLYAAFSFRRRFIELGMLRAIGLSAGQMTALLAAELVFLIATGLVVGTILGLGISYAFVPYLQIGTSTAAQYPPFQVEIAWGSIFQVYALFVLLFIAGLAGLAALLLRMKIFQAIKLGDTT